MANIEAVAFDAYGTVIDFNEPDFITAMAEICDRQGLQADAADLWRRFLRAALALRSENHARPIYRRYYEAWALQFDRVFRQLDLPGDPWAAANYLKDKLASAPAFDEAYAVIEALRPYYRLALLSNADDDFLAACLERNGLEFDTVVTSEQARAIKPDPAIFQHLARVLALEPSFILYVGDNPLPDILGARQAGLRVAWVNRFNLRRPRRVPPPDIRVKSLSELLPILLCSQGPSPDRNGKMPQFKRYILSNHCYFVTTATQKRRPYFTDVRLSRLIIDNLRFYRVRMAFRLHGYVIMPDHVHLLITPVGCTISDIMRNFKSFTSKQIRETLEIRGAIWQPRFYDRVIRDESQFVAALNYIHLNPVKDGLVSAPEDYEFSSCRAYAQCGTPPLEIDLLDWSRLGP